ncbi:MAG TPA: tRNA (guanosine(46)-N7)-methyltransferase TrmB [Candidatus Saccharimonadaceae bacterium]|nr:tRNA (guanosine(46)-N7)-methyltransferase TrmB [Candidatus Saccharimonadaceae bacterium]
MSEPLNPDDFIITRKRKKYKFAKFHNAENCFELKQWDKRHIDVAEIGAGTGLFAVELAALHPGKIFAAVDVKADRLQKGAYQALERGLKNVVFIRARADQIDQLFAAQSLEQIWLTFPDPFPRKHSAGRRLTHPHFLEKYAALLKGSTLNRENKMHSSSLYLKHDNVEFFHWSLEQLVAEKWHIDELSFDLHESELADDYKILTTYEKRWLGEGLKTNFARVHVAK